MSNNDLKLFIEEEASKEGQELLFNGIDHEAYLAKGLDPIQTFGVFLRDPNGNRIGGLTGITYWGYLFIDMLGLPKNLRHSGYGTKLMDAAEKVGIERGCKFSTVTTMDWEARPFYEKLGYVVEFTRDGYQKNSSMYFLQKA
ncbi:MAG: GNAT family N-acetyltransferase, partial [Parachlamydiales bacterium]|nr:GNAT family N-acetyltransferase [Parachlamydiales bacterium]